MYIEKVHFEEVFDVHPGRGDFSFRGKGRVCYAVNLQRRVIPRAGSSYMVAFAKPDDWSTVLGWLDLDTRIAMLKQPAWLVALSELSFMIWFAPLFLAAGLFFGGPSAGLAVLVIIFCLACLRFYQVARRNRRVRQGLCNAQC